MSPTNAPQSPVSWDDLDRYLAGECTDAGKAAAVRAYLARVDNAEQLLKQASRLTDRPQSPPSSIEGWNALAARLALNARRKTVSSLSHQSRPLAQRVLPYLLAGVVMTAIGIFVGWHERGVHTILSATARATVYATTNGQRANITLPDGSTVALNVASRLEVPADFAGGHHTVTLTGEAFFTVAHHDKNPFAVVSGPTTTRVLGTSFVVSRYANDNATTVAVQDGKVAVGPTVVTAQRMVTVGESGVASEHNVDSAMFSFATGILTLNNTPLSVAIPELNRWFDADIRLGDPALAQLRIGGKFAAGSLADLTHLLAMAFDVRIVRVGRTVTLYPKD